MDRHSFRSDGKSACLRALLFSFYQTIAKRRRYWLPLLFFSVLSYGFGMANRTVGIDDLCRASYVGGGHRMIAGTRWGMLVWNKLFSTADYTPFADKFLGLCMLLIAAGLLSCMLYALCGKSCEVWQYTVFSSLFVSYPLIHEIWEYNGTNLMIGGNFVLVALALLYQLSAPRFSPRTVIAAGLIMTPVMASYESGVFAYITLIFVILLFRYGFADKGGGRACLREGLCYAAPLAVALVLRYGIGFLLILLTGVAYEPNGDTMLRWITPGVRNALKSILSNLAYYGARALVYPPIAIFAAAAAGFILFVFVRSIRTRRASPAVIGLLLLCAVFSQSLLQGLYLPYRTAQPVQVFVAFAGFLVMRAFGGDTGRVTLRRAVTILMLFICLRQSLYLHSVLALNNQRSDNEAAVIRQLGMRLTSEFDTDKPVVFTGELDLGDWISSRLAADEDSLGERAQRRIMEAIGFSYDPEDYIDTDVNSCINWCKTAFGGEEQFETLFSYYGYDIRVLPGTTGERLAQAERRAAELGMHPFEIRDDGDYILVYLGVGTQTSP